MRNCLKFILPFLASFLFSLPSVDKALAKLRIGSRIEAHYFGDPKLGNPKLGIGIVYNVLESEKKQAFVGWSGRYEWSELYEVKQRSIEHLYRPTGSEALSLSFGFKNFTYVNRYPPLECKDCFQEDHFIGLWLGFSGNIRLSLLSKRFKLLGETGVTLGREMMIPEFSSGLLLEITRHLRVGYHQIGLKNTVTPMGMPLNFGGLRVGLDLTYP